MSTVTQARVITLPRQPERLAAFLGWRRSFPLPVGLPAPRVHWGVDAAGLGHAVGVGNSHAQCLYEFAAEPGDPADWLLVFEDDARWGAELSRAWPLIAPAVPLDADMVFLGGAVDVAGTLTPITERLARVRGIYRMHAYLVRRGSAFRAARIMVEKPGEHCDILVSRASEDGRLAVCAARPFLVAQRPGSGWYAWNGGEGGIETPEGLSIYAKYALGVPAPEQRRAILYGAAARTAEVQRQTRGGRVHLVAHADGDIAVLSADPADAPPKPAPVSDPERKRSLELARAKCDHLGKQLRAGCSGSLYECGKHNVQVTRVGSCVDAKRTCATCPDHTHLAKLAAAPVLPADLVAAIDRTQSLPGWCPREKAHTLADLVLKEKPAVCVEIGVYGGRSLLPVALALRHVGAGVAHAVDSWTPADASIGDPNPPESLTTGLADARRQFEAAVDREQVGPQVKLRPLQAQNAASEFQLGSISLLHIDGNHSAAEAEQDVRTWLPKVRPGGYIAFDDTDMPSTQGALALLAAACDVVSDHPAPWPPWRLFRKRATVAPVARPGWVQVPAPPALSLTPTKPIAVVTVVVGDEARAIHRASGPHLKRYAERVGADLVVLDWPGAPGFPITSKFQIGRVLDHYERIAFVDADTLLRPAAVNLFEMCAPTEFGFCDEREPQQRVPGFDRQAVYLQFRRDLGFAAVDPVPWYMNSGVMVVPKSHQHILDVPDRPIPVAHCSEQDWISAKLLDSGLPYRILDRRANWQSWIPPGLPGAPADAVLHWSGSGSNAGRAVAIREWAARFPWPG